MREELKQIARVKMRGGFSDRNKINPISTEIQIDSFSERTKTMLYNKLDDILQDIAESYEGYDSCFDFNKLYVDVFKNVYCLDMARVDSDRRSYGEIFGSLIRDTIYKGDYDEVLTLIEFIANWTAKHFKERKYYVVFENDIGRSVQYDEFGEFNSFFEQECIGYRFIDNKIVSITDTTEVNEIQETLDCQFQGCKTHISKAVGFLADRENKDYKNCIKESISAVESICKIIVKNDKATLGDALKELEKKNGLKGQLKSGFEKLYNYTNDKGGIRHAEGLFESNVTFEEAKFMLVSCCSFVNYLIAEYGKQK